MQPTPPPGPTWPEASAPALLLGGRRAVVAIGDLHFPWANQEYLHWLYDVLKATKPGLVIQLGDLRDMYAGSKYPRSHNIMTPDAEEEMATAQASLFWERVKGAVGKRTKLVQLIGNHDARLSKRAAEASLSGLIEKAVASEFRRLYTFPGVETVWGSNEDWSHDGVVYVHGGTWKTPAQGAAYFRQPVVYGHTHQAGLDWTHDRFGTYWGFNVGCGIDVASPVFDYRAWKNRDKVSLGVGLIDGWGPRFVAYQPSRERSEGGDS